MIFGYAFVYIKKINKFKTKLCIKLICNNFFRYILFNFVLLKRHDSIVT